MDIVDPTDKTVDALMKPDLPAGVDVEIKLQPRLHHSNGVGFYSPDLLVKAVRAILCGFCFILPT